MSRFQKGTIFGETSGFQQDGQCSLDVRAVCLESDPATLSSGSSCVAGGAWCLETVHGTNNTVFGGPYDFSSVSMSAPVTLGQPSKGDTLHFGFRFFSANCW